MMTVMSDDAARGTKPGPPPLPKSSPRMPAARPQSSPVNPEVRATAPTDPAISPVPTPEGFMSRSAQMSLADVAMKLRDEQLRAKVVHYRADLATNADLDAVTAQVIADLQGLQAAARAVTPAVQQGPQSTREVEAELTQNLSEQLGRIFRPNRLATLIERKLGEVAKRFARLFFESELAEKLRGTQGEAKVLRFSDQALYLALTKMQENVFATLDSFHYAEPAVKVRAQTAYLALVKNLRNEFLARTTPELNVLVKYLNETLSLFFTSELPQELGVLASQVVRDAGLASAKTTAGYKISSASFPDFRRAFERRFLERLVPFTEDDMLRRVREAEGQFRSETLRFVADPLIFSEVCGVVCEAVYDLLYNDGFLDLPSDWRARLSAGD